MLKKSKILCLLIVIALLSGSFNVSSQPINIDTYLINAGFPQELVNQMSTPQKEYIYANSVGESITFCGYTEEQFTITDDGNLIKSSSMSTRDGFISPSDMTISVVGTRVYTTAGNVYYKVFPNFKWHTHKVVANDSFAMTMYSGWEAIPGEENFRLHLLNNQGQSVQYVDLPPTTSANAGYVYKIPSNVGFMQALYEGYGYYSLNKISTTASPSISLNYIHDASPSYNLSYNITISKLFEISISGNTSEIYTMSGNFYVSGLDQ